MEFKLAIGDPSSKRVFKAELKDADAEKLLGKKISEKFKGELLGLGGYEFEITGGSDNAGFPMRRDVSGAGRKRVILTSGVGFHSKRKGLRRRKSVRGNTISTDTVQVNVKVVKAGKKKLADVFGAPKEKEAKDTSEQAPRASTESGGEPKAEVKAEVPKEEKPAEAPKKEK